jgi:hypothetical protein
MAFRQAGSEVSVHGSPRASKLSCGANRGEFFERLGLLAAALEKHFVPFFKSF